MKSIMTIIFLLTLSSCSTLTEEASKVRIKSDVPDSCKALGDVSAGDSGFSRGSATDVKVAMRNEVAELGGNTLIIDNISAVFAGGYSGTGRAFNCAKP
jgi:hypothetical protein